MFQGRREFVGGHQIVMSVPHRSTAHVGELPFLEMSVLSRAWLIASLSALTASLSAQMGDARDKEGTTQKPPPAAWIRPAPLLSPEESLKTFTLPPGFHIELVAAEPLVPEPVVL